MQQFETVTPPTFCLSTAMHGSRRCLPLEYLSILTRFDWCASLVLFRYWTLGLHNDQSNVMITSWRHATGLSWRELDIKTIFCGLFLIESSDRLLRDICLCVIFNFWLFAAVVSTLKVSAWTRYLRILLVVICVIIPYISFRLTYTISHILLAHGRIGFNRSDRTS